ncbi:hypothetical protein [Streptomyces sp. NPDC058739]|uniref:Mu transposase domain-containing protein n=1 Tax=Streptomyces sp. NPDC058739 TaxID=3346618 RepID=UPI0036D18C43
MGLFEGVSQGLYFFLCGLSRRAVGWQPGHRLSWRQLRRFRPRWWQTSVRIGRDHYIRLDTCDYSVHPAAIGRIVRIEADTETVRAHCRGIQQSVGHGARVAVRGCLRRLVSSELPTPAKHG